MYVFKNCYSKSSALECLMNNIEVFSDLIFKCVGKFIETTDIRAADITVYYTTYTIPH